MKIKTTRSKIKNPKRHPSSPSATPRQGKALRQKAEGVKAGLHAAQAPALREGVRRVQLPYFGRDV